MGTAADRARQLKIETNNVAQGRRSGTRLWREARSQVQGQPPHADDRPLYWSRLSMTQRYKLLCTEVECQPLLGQFEQASRGIFDLRFSRQADLQILLTGFDPFNLDQNIEQSNPSGLLALQLDNTRLTSTTNILSTHPTQRRPVNAEIQAVILPVRFHDFDDALVELLLTPLLRAGEVDAIFTLSMGRDNFDLERFPGRRRASQAPDNLNHFTGANPNNPMIPLLYGRPLPGPEFLEFSLPIAELTSIQTPYKVNDNRQVSTLERGAFAAQSLKALAGLTAVAGSGGTYLSNEVAYRALRIVQTMQSPVAVGHIHVPRINGHDKPALEKIHRQLIAMLKSSLSALQPATRPQH